MRDFNTFWRKIERIVNFWKRKFLVTRFRCKTSFTWHRTNGGQIFDRLNIRAFRRSVNRTGQKFERHNLGQIFSRYGRKFDQRDLNTITVAVRVQIPIIRNLAISHSASKLFLWFRYPEHISYMEGNNSYKQTNKNNYFVWSSCRSISHYQAYKTISILIRRSKNWLRNYWRITAWKCKRAKEE